MTLRFLEPLDTEVGVNVADNTAGLVTPALLREVLEDMIDSLKSRGAGLVGDNSAAPVAQAVTDTPISYPMLYTLEVNEDPDVFTVNQVGGTITLLKTGFIHEFSIGFLVEGGNGLDCRAVLLKNGVPSTSVLIAVQTSGPGELKSAYIAMPAVGIVAGDVISLGLYAESGTPTFDFSEITLAVSLHPTLSAT